jgi:NADH-quinone oxidoreductase subunit G
VDVWVRDNVVMRLTPRENKQVNDYWMCDEGRLDYMRSNQQRVSGIKLQNDIPVPHKDGLARVADRLTLHKGKVVFVGSGYTSLENNYVLQQLAKGQGVDSIVYLPDVQAGWGDQFLRRDNRLPNEAAVQLLGFAATTPEALSQQIAQAELVVVLEDNRVAELAVKQGKAVIALATQYFEGANDATILLPAATNFEMAGIYINCDQVAQLTQQAKQVRQMTPEMWMAMPKSRLDAGGVAIDNWRNPDNIIDCLPSWLMLNAVAALLGQDLPYTTHKELFAHLKGIYPQALAGVELPKRNRKESFKISQFDFAIG